jgi:predicted secreted protein
MADMTARAAGRRPFRWAFPLIAFLLGVALGVVGVGLLSSGKPDFPTTSGLPTSVSTTAEPTSPAAGASAAAAVNPACLQVINEAQEISNILSGVGQAATDVDLQRLDDIVRQLQPIEPQLAADLRACKVDTSVGSGPGDSLRDTPGPTATPS